MSNNNKVGIPGRGKQSKSKQAKAKIQEACAKKTNQPIRKSASAGCCPEIYPWNVHEKNRSYILNVTKEVDKKIMGSNATRKGAAEAISKGQEEKQHEFHIVAPPLSVNNLIQHKKITVEHTFIKNDCNHVMLARNDFYKEGKELGKDGVFEIDSNGHIQGAKNISCEKYELERKKELILERYANCSEKVKAFHNRTRKFENSEKHQDAVDDALQKDLKRCENDYTTAMKTLIDEEEVEELSDLEIIFKALLNPRKISKKIIIHPIGSNKCNSQPKVKLFVYPFIKLDGGFSLMYTKATTTKIPSSAKLETNQTEVKVSGKLNMYYGSKIISYGGSIESGGGSYKRKVKPMERRQKQKGKNIFTTMEGILNIFKDAEDAKKQYDARQGRSLTGKFKFFKFDPGKSGITVTIKKYELKEIKDKHQIDYANNVSLTINILNGISIKADIIEFLILIATVEAPYVGGLLSRARDSAEKGIGGKNANLKIGAKLDLSINGGISAIFSWDKKLEKEIKFDKAKIAGTIGFRAEALIYAEGKLLFVTIKGKAGVMAASEKNVTTPCQAIFTGELINEGNKILLGGGVDFTGLSLYYVMNGDIEIQRRSTSNNNGSGTFGKGTTQKASTDIGKYTNDKAIPILKEWEPTDKSDFIDLEQFLT